MSRPRLLLVEDESLIAMLMEDMLSDLGCDVIASIDGLASALRWLAAQDRMPDGAVLDVNLGGEMVFPLAEALAEREVPFVFATGYGALADDRFPHAPLLHKPVNPGLLAAAVERFKAAA